MYVTCSSHSREGQRQDLSQAVHLRLCLRDRGPALPHLSRGAGVVYTKAGVLVSPLLFLLELLFLCPGLPGASLSYTQDQKRRYVLADLSGAGACL